jgi:hypothetical protein
MATEEQKKRQMVRVFSIMIEGLARGIYDLFEDSAYALMKTVGENLLEIMQKEMGLEIEGEEPIDVLNELLRIWVDEIGFFEDAKVEETEKGWVIVGNNCKGWNLSKKLQDSGVKEPFTCPIMNSMNAALGKMKIKTHMHIEPQPKTRGTRFTLTKA